MCRRLRGSMFFLRPPGLRPGLTHSAPPALVMLWLSLVIGFRLVTSEAEAQIADDL
jgi:hypothetical protein